MGKRPFTDPTFYQRIRKIFKILGYLEKQLFLLKLVSIENARISGKTVVFVKLIKVQEKFQANVR